MKRSCSFFRIFTLLVAFISASFAAWPSHADCPRLPAASWWSLNTHESVIREVLDRHYGDWSPYIAKWETRLDRMENIQAQGKKTAYIRRGSATFVIKNLPAYITKLKKRIAAIYCLREESRTALVSGKVVIPRKGNPERGETLSRTAGCFGCHAVYGVSNTRDVPNLAGQNDLYLVKQLKEFQISHGSGDSSGVFGRHSKVMDMQVTKLSDEDIWDLATFYSERSCTPGSQRGGTNVSSPKKAVLCVECHGDTGYSVYREIPNLTGQSESYLFKQLKALRMSSTGPGRST